MKVSTFEDVGIYEERKKEKINQQLGRYVDAFCISRKK